MQGTAQPELCSHVLGVAARRGGDPGHLTHEDGRFGVLELEARQLGMMLERRRTVAGLGRLGHPELDGVHLFGPGRILLGVGHPVACGHEVQLAGPDELLGTQAVEMQEFAGHEPRHGLEAHVGMRADAEGHARFDRDGARMIDEAPRPDGAARSLRQHPADWQRPDLGEAPRGDLDQRAVGPGGSLGNGCRVVGGDWSTHDVPFPTHRVAATRPY